MFRRGETKKLINSCKAKCPNPEGKLGICYGFDRYGDRCGCMAINCNLLTDKLYGSNGDPLPGLTKQIKDLSNIKKK